MWETLLALIVMALPLSVPMALLHRRVLRSYPRPLPSRRRLMAVWTLSTGAYLLPYEMIPGPATYYTTPAKSLATLPILFVALVVGLCVVTSLTALLLHIRAGEAWRSLRSIAVGFAGVTVVMACLIIRNLWSTAP